MRLKPGLFQLTVIVMTVSLLASCTKTKEASQCNTPQTAQQSNNCDDSGGSHGSSGFHYGSSGSRVGSSSNEGSESDSASKAGRGGFGSFGRGSHAGG